MVLRTLSELDIHYPDSPLNGETNGRRWSPHGVRPGDRLPDIRVHVPATGADDWLLRLLRGPRFHVLLLPAAGEPYAMETLAGIHEQLTAYAGLVESRMILPATAMPAPLPSGASGGGEGRPWVWLDPRDSLRRLVGARATALLLVRPTAMSATVPSRRCGRVCALSGPLLAPATPPSSRQ